MISLKRDQLYFNFYVFFAYKLQKTSLLVRRFQTLTPSRMDAGYSMDATVLMQKLVEKDINTKLLIEFYEEVVENEKVFCSMVEEISDADEIEERQKSVDHIESFCLILRELRTQYQYILGDEHLFLPEAAKREKMISNASRFIELLEKECNLEFPDTNDF